MTNGMKWFVLCAVVFLLFVAAVTLLPARADNCGRSGVRQVIPGSVSNDIQPTIVCNNGSTVQP